MAFHQGAARPALGRLAQDLDRLLAVADAQLATDYPGDGHGRQPVHTVYVPAHRFAANTVRLWGTEALAALDEFAAEPAEFAEAFNLSTELAAQVLPLVQAKLADEPIEDLRIDFEDGYGTRSDETEDAHARAAARSLASVLGANAAPPFTGIRCKSLEPKTRRRAIATIDAFLGALAEIHAEPPPGFVFTLPKVTSAAQVNAMTVLCERFESAYGLSFRGRLSFELQVEMPQLILGADGAATIARCIHAGRDRLVGLHYGTYDYSAAVGISAAQQRLDHPAADYAKAVMQVAAAGTGVRLSDGSSNVLPVGSRNDIVAAWQLHSRLVRRSLERGFCQGWDSHPAQLVSRYAATYGFYREGFSAASDRPGPGRVPRTRHRLRRLHRGQRRGPNWPGPSPATLNPPHRPSPGRALTGNAGPELAIVAGRVLTPDGIKAAQVRVRAGQISAVTVLGDRKPKPPDETVVAVLDEDEVLLPGLVDSHVHVNEPGRTDWEGFATATAAAAAGGVTTVIDMPLNSIPPTTDVAALNVKRAAAAGQCSVDVGFWGGAVPGNSGELAGLHEAGVFGFKCFTVDSGVPEFPPLDDAGLAEAMRRIAELGSLLIVHAEDAGRIGSAAGRRYDDFVASRPDAAEVAAVTRVIELARQTRARVHVLHASSAEVVPLLAAAQADGVRISAETCPHYLTLAAERVRDGQTQFKCCPPIRDEANRERLWEALAAGVISCVVSDHSPCPADLKQLGTGDFGTAWGGISSVQLGLPVTWTQARERGFSLADVVGWMASGPAALVGLGAKGAIEVGRDADLVAFAPDEWFIVRLDQLLTRHRLTPYAGQRLQGVVRRTWARGRPAVGAGQQTGRLLARGTS